MPTPTKNPVAPSEPPHDQDASPDAPVTPKQERANLDLSSIRSVDDQNAHVSEAGNDKDNIGKTEDTDDKSCYGTDHRMDAGKIQDGTNDGAVNQSNSTANECANDGSPAPQAECETFTNLERIRSSAARDTVGEGVNVGIKSLNGLHALLKPESKDGKEAARWIGRFGMLKRKLKQTRTVVGILGNTGAGKSTLINALLDEENIIPTNCMRACTAVPTGICYNHDDNHSQPYRGEAEFISEEDWQKEVGLLLAELVDPTKKLSKDYLQSDTGAGIAYAKIKAVYPHLSNDKLAKSSVKDLMEDAAVMDVLGTVRSHKRSKASNLKSDLQIYVDSAERHGADGHANTAMAYWPLIKLVRIYLKSKMLSTGTVLVDLPGVQDSNAARSAVAERFRAECSSAWIVSPINRAVDDKAAKHLLGTSFKLQLTMDGNYSNVTYICSKTDEISVREVADKLDSDGAIQSLWTKEEECRRNLSKLKRERQGLVEERDELDEMRDEIEALRSKKRKLVDCDTDGQQPESQGVCSSDAVDAADGNAEEQAALLRNESVRIRKRLKELTTQMSSLQMDCTNLKTEATARCVEARNKYSMNAIRSDFAEGVREMVEDAETQEAEGTQSTAEPDYAQIAQSLPVFCVSSRGYQCLLGRSKDSAIEGYRAPADTQIPQLQEHAMRLGELELATTRKVFLADLARLLRSLLLWASGGETGTSIWSDDDFSRVTALDTRIGTLRVELDNLIKTASTGIRTGVETDLLEPISPMCMKVAHKLPDIASGWPENGNSAGRPLRLATYRSICINGGKGVSPMSRGMNFNEDLFVLLKKQMAVHWASTFGSTFNDGMAVYAAGAIEALETFHKAVLDSPELDCAKSANLGVLNDQVNALTQSIRQAESKFKVTVKLKQRVGSRWFVKSIADYMKEIYERCASMHGAGCWARVKEAMVDFVYQNRQEILTRALEEVGAMFVDICSSFERQMKKQAEEVQLKLKEDYQVAILGREMILSNSDTSPSLRAVQGKVRQMLVKVDDEFAAILRNNAMKECSHGFA